MKIDLKSRRVRVVSSLVITLLAMAALARLKVVVSQHDEDPEPNIVDVPGVPIYDGVFTRQEFVAEDDNIVSVSLRLATYARENAGELQVDLAKRRNRRWVPLATASLEKRLLVDNADRVFTFPKPVNVRAGDKLALTLSADGPYDSAITWRFFPGLSLPGYRLLVGQPTGQEILPGTAAFRVAYRGAVGMAGGPYMRGVLWKRISIFLNAPGRVFLATGFLVALFSLICLMLAPAPLRSEREPSSNDME